ncbi:MAG: hypothetical protein A2934_02125 [Candidatus Sungbacteria bacterium RIFCSPLOWO2_01_FULL_47_10]|uniref:DUF2283 domain-containing protein n=1 Tax=Candidatus Sungbacteria bacterium RIFCSPLOWO2_01_FULL_47_10 TaxID=1802276 RepID=A0A1G2L141_9BACT|nr:MAG: hypothetical protein A2934_02125 [Candidatus Sungbacteria bacterium RIFCSPLOWO2_01_FULL_47_10]
MKTTYDKQSDALYMQLTAGRVKRTVKVNPRVLVDVDEKGNVVGVEFLFVSQRLPKSALRSRAIRIPVR